MALSVLSKIFNILPDLLPASVLQTTSSNSSWDDKNLIFWNTSNFVKIWQQTVNEMQFILRCKLLLGKFKEYSNQICLTNLYKLTISLWIIFERWYCELKINSLAKLSLVWILESDSWLDTVLITHCLLDLLCHVIYFTNVYSYSWNLNNTPS